MKLSESNMLAGGMTFLVLGFAASYFETFGFGVHVFAFSSGLFIGLSLVMNLGYLIRKRGVHTLKRSLSNA